MNPSSRKTAGLPSGGGEMCFTTRARAQKPGLASWLTFGVILAVQGLIAPPLLAAATITMTPASGAPGAIPSVWHVLSTGGAAISAVSLEIAYDPAKLTFTDAYAGAAASGAGKQVITSSPHLGLARIAIYGLNQTLMGGGQLVCARFAINTGTPPGAVPLTLTCMASDAAGNPVAITGTGAALTVGGCGLTCTAFADPSAGEAPLNVSFYSSVDTGACAGPIVYDWDFGDGSSHATTQNASHSYPEDGSFTWVFSVTANSSADLYASCTQRGTVTVQKSGSTCKLSCTATAPTTGTAGSPISFASTATPSGCTGTPAFAWTFGDGQTSTSQNPTHTYATAGTYDWTLAATVQGVTCVKDGAITIGGACTQPSISGQPQSQTIPSGLTVALSVTASGTTPLSYQWYQGASGTTSTPVGTNSNSFTSPVLTTTTSYWVRVTNSCGHADSSTATVTVTTGCVLTCGASANPTSGSVPLTVAFTASAIPVNCTFESSVPGAPVSHHSTSVILRTLQRDTSEESSESSAIRSLGEFATIQPQDDRMERRLEIHPSTGGESVTVLTSGVPVAGSVGSGQWAYYKIAVPEGATQFSVQTSGASVDLDLYVRFGSPPDAETYDYRPWTLNGNEIVVVTPLSTPRPIGAGDWFIGVNGPSAGGSFTISATVGNGGSGVTLLASGSPTNDTVPHDPGYKLFSFVVPAGAIQLIVSTTNTNKDVDLYVRYGVPPDPDHWDYRPYSTSGNETVTVNPSSEPRPLTAGVWFFVVSGYCSEGCAFTITATVTGGSTCTLACTATAPAAGTAGTPVAFTSTATPSNCTGGATFAWTFGDGSTSGQQNPTHAYANAGTYSWSLTTSISGVTCTKTGSITVSGGSGTTFSWTFGDGTTSNMQNPGHTYAAAGTFPWTMTASWNGKTCAKSGAIQVGAGGKPGDCDGNDTISIGEVQKAINMFLGTLAPDCGVDCNGDGTVSIGEVQKVINGFLGLSAVC